MPDPSSTTSRPQDDREMVAALRDPESPLYRYHNDVWNQWREYFFRIARAKGLGVDDAEDLAQEAFLRAQKALANFRFESTLKTFMHSVFGYCLLDWLRMRQRKEKSIAEAPTRGVQEDDGTGDEREPPSRALPLEESVANLDLLRLVIAEVKRIHSDRDFQLFCMHYIEGWPMIEIAETMAMPYTSVNTILRRTAAHFRRGGDRYALILRYLDRQNQEE